MFYLSITLPCYAWKSHPYLQKEPKGIGMSNSTLLDLISSFLFHALKCSSIRGCGLWSKLAIKGELMKNFLERFYISAAGTFLEPFLAPKCKVQSNRSWFETLTAITRWGGGTTGRNQFKKRCAWVYLPAIEMDRRRERGTEQKKNRKGMHMVFIVTLG